MEPAARERFEREVMPHLDAAYTLARWLVRDQHGAEDVVQDALIRAMRAIAGSQANIPHILSAISIEFPGQSFLGNVVPSPW